jgi:hypothetical protein
MNALNAPEAENRHWFVTNTVLIHGYCIYFRHRVGFALLYLSCSACIV